MLVQGVVVPGSVGLSTVSGVHSARLELAAPDKDLGVADLPPTLDICLHGELCAPNRGTLKAIDRPLGLSNDPRQ